MARASKTAQLLLSFDEFRLFGRAIPFDLSGRSLSEDEKKANPTPDWGDLRARSLEALAKSKDLRVLTHLAGGPHSHRRRGRVRATR